jgi:hypothetical protein
MLQEFESITTGSELNETTFGGGTAAGFTFEVRANPSLLEVHVIRAVTPLSIFAQTLALINGALGIGALVLKWIATKCGRHKVTRGHPSETTSSSAQMVQFDREPSTTSINK